jgi:NAD(P)-dependent dehydrogenase (short-subunit alcohol dehydrogenase family)
MTLFDAFRYDGKRVLVVGGATGMGAAAAELVQDAGAEVVVMDYADVKLPGAKAIHVNLADKDSIDAAVDECGGPVHALFSCAGVADGTPGIEKINFVGHRHLIDRMLAGGMLPRGSAIGFISSAAGLGWEANLRRAAGATWPRRTSTAACSGSPRTARRTTSRRNRRCVPTSPRRRSAAASAGSASTPSAPGRPDTPLAEANAETWLGFGADYREELGTEPSTPLEQAYPLVFLCSDAAAAITGITLITDGGYISSGITGRSRRPRRRQLPARRY